MFRLKETNETILQNMDLIRQRDFDSFFDKCIVSEISEITTYFMQKGIMVWKYQTKIFPQQFSQLEQEEFEIPSNIKKIGESAFDESDLHKIIIPKTVTDVHAYAFEYCNRLEEIIIENKDVKLGRYCFVRTTDNLKHIVIPKAYSNMFKYLFGTFENVYDEFSRNHDVEVEFTEDVFG